MIIGFSTSENLIPNVKCDVVYRTVAGEPLTSVLINHGNYLPMLCNGRGTCGKCAVRILEGDFPETPADTMQFDHSALLKGYRLACRAVIPAGCCAIEISDSDSAISVLTVEHSDSYKAEKESRPGIAIDIGTTTIAMALVDITSGDVIGTHTFVNRQRVYGADVISRIQAANDGNGAQLHRIIIDDLTTGIRTLCSLHNISLSVLSEIVVAGNTTMLHLLRNLPTNTLGVYPFTPVDIAEYTDSAAKFLEMYELNCPITLLPGISTYVGADIVAGLIDSEVLCADTPSLLIDLGTNGELALGTRGKVLVTSTAAGPAFEGGNISNGIASVPGAITDVTIHPGYASISTIGDKSAVGYCGTGLIAIVSEMLARSIIDETGAFVSGTDYCLNGLEITNVTQKDIREFQLAKAAVRAGIEALTAAYGIKTSDIGKVYISGGLGTFLDISKAVNTGLLPKCFIDKVSFLGNSSLSGTIKYMTDPKARKAAAEIINISREVSLSNETSFNDFFIEYMSFESEESL